MMTERQLEAAARELCRLRGVNNGNYPLLDLMNEIRAAEKLQAAIEHGRAQKEEGE